MKTQQTYREQYAEAIKPAAPAQAQHSPLIASTKVDKWLDELRKILVDRSEFKLADNVVSARVVIKMLEKKRCEAEAHAQRLADALRASVSAMDRMDTRLLTLTNSPKECEKGEIVRAREALAEWE